MEADISSQAVGLASSADFSLINLFIRADIIVKSVIIILIACSIYSWAIIIENTCPERPILANQANIANAIMINGMVGGKRIKARYNGFSLKRYR